MWHLHNVVAVTGMVISNCINSFQYKTQNVLSPKFVCFNYYSFVNIVNAISQQSYIGQAVGLDPKKHL